MEKKTITAPIDVFIAADGTQFNTEDDCLDYEYRNLAIFGIKMLDYALKTTADLDDAFYVYLGNDAQLQVFKASCNYNGVSTFGLKLGFNIWGEDLGLEGWVNSLAFFKDLILTDKHFNEACKAADIFTGLGDKGNDE